MAENESIEEQEQDVSNEELEEIQDAYSLYCKRQVKEAEDEEIEEQEALLPTTNLPYAMKDVGYTPTEAEVFSMIDDVDPNGTGFIDFKTFLFLVKSHVKPLNEEQLRIAFTVFDRDGNGFLAISELQYVTRNMGVQYSEDEIQDMLKEVDADGDLKINFEDFCYFMTRH